MGLPWKTRWKNISLIFMLGAIGFISCGAKEKISPPEAVSSGLVLSPEGLVLREKPGKGFKKIGLLPSGGLVEIMDRSGPEEVLHGVRAPWFRVRYQGREGWAFSRFLADEVCTSETVPEWVYGSWYSHMDPPTWVYTFYRNGNITQTLYKYDEKGNETGKMLKGTCQYDHVCLLKVKWDDGTRNRFILKRSGGRYTLQVWETGFVFDPDDKKQGG